MEAKMKRAGLTGMPITAAGHALMAAKGAFAGAYGVTSTGIVCVAGCPARAPLAKNVLVYASVAAAEAEGFRQCKRCLDVRKSQAKVH
jgi:AraC family transcriptional regulator, regulatory protein of adaptative response / methylated-DNA-[protein]-cysteine methyltransferase